MKKIVALLPAALLLLYMTKSSTRLPSHAIKTLIVPIFRAVKELVLTKEPDDTYSDLYEKRLGIPFAFKSKPIKHIISNISFDMINRSRYLTLSQRSAETNYLLLKNLVSTGSYPYTSQSLYLSIDYSQRKPLGWETEATTGSYKNSLSLYHDLIDGFTSNKKMLIARAIQTNSPYIGLLAKQCPLKSASAEECNDIKTLFATRSAVARVSMNIPECKSNQPLNQYVQSVMTTYYIRRIPEFNSKRSFILDNEERICSNIFQHLSSRLHISKAPHKENVKRLNELVYLYGLHSFLRSNGFTYSDHPPFAVYYANQTD